ncbi:HK97 family phage prohead protease [Mesorhizobium australicum]|uniref:HK97 family phage prohead protease n=1 Tax=Mesorhizobium australicum TaxID=536018 RepID=A0ACC6T6B9_9HYPH
MTTEIERRHGIPAEIRADDTGIKVSGYAAVFGQITDIGDYFREVIEPGAFRDAIGRDDVVFLINHEGLPLARTRSGTLKLSEDAHGLLIETTLDPTDPDVMSIVPKMKRGDLDKMSFAFRADVQIWDDTQDPPLRTIQKASLYDVAIVTTPAYDGTEIGLRTLEAARNELDQARKDAEKRATDAAAAKRRVAEREARQEQRIRGIQSPDGDGQDAS